MGFFQFLFSLMFVIPVGLIMIYLLKRLRNDVSDALKRETYNNEQDAKHIRENRYEGRNHYQEYSNLNNRVSFDRKIPYQSSYSTRENNFKEASFGRSTAEIRKKELEKKEQVDKKNSVGFLDKRKRRKERQKRKRDK